MRTLSSLLLLALPLFGLENTTCQKCHPKIYQEYQRSIHAKASIYTDAIHKAVWDKHPAKPKGNYNCAVCHTPADHALTQHKGLPADNAIQHNEPISCQSCHTIESIQTHAKRNINHYTDKPKYFYAADKQRKGQKVIFKEEKSLFGLLTHTTGSPYHDIDYSNENFYNGGVCLGCHDHKQNGKGFSICDLEVKQTPEDPTCMGCHMPQTQGAVANQKQTQTHAFHGNSIHQTPKHLASYVPLSLTTDANGFSVTIENQATHTLFPQPLREGQLRVSITHQGKTTTLPPVSFKRTIGKAGKPAMPWLATEVLNDSTIKAKEKRAIHFDTPLHPGDEVTLTLGYYLVNPKAAKALNITQEEATQFIVLNKTHITIP